jgi:hypothetical protein
VTVVVENPPSLDDEGRQVANVAVGILSKDCPICTMCNAVTRLLECGLRAEARGWAVGQSRGCGVTLPPDQSPRSRPCLGCQDTG